MVEGCCYDNYVVLESVYNNKYTNQKTKCTVGMQQF